MTTSARVVRVWDAPVRLLHWTLAGAVAVSSLALVDTLGLSAWHRPAGYVALVAVLLRLGWSLIGTRHARFGGFFRGPRATARYLMQVMRAREPRFIGHNPLGGWMVVALIVCVGGLALTGWLYTTDAFFGSEQVEDIHRALAWTLASLVVLHVAGVLFTSVRHRENLVRAMLDGSKRAATGDDID